MLLSYKLIKTFPELGRAPISGHNWPYLSVLERIYVKEQQKYELAFHLNPDLEETQVQQIFKDIENYITSNGGTVSFRKEPERTRLSYPIDHKQQSYFGYYHFKIEEPENLSNIDEQIKLSDGMLRYLLVKVPPGADKAKFSFRPSRPKVKEDKPTEKQAPTDGKELEKQLEGVLENL